MEWTLARQAWYLPTRAASVKGAQMLLRLGLAAGFLSAVADRLGVWGPPGARNVAWGDWSTFVDYVATLNWFAPTPLIPVVAWAATLAETVLAVGLIVGWRLQRFGLASGLLLSTFAVTMTMAQGVKAPLDFSVFSAAGGAFLLAAIASGEAPNPHRWCEVRQRPTDRDRDVCGLVPDATYVAGDASAESAPLLRNPFTGRMVALGVSPRRPSPETVRCIDA